MTGEGHSEVTGLSEAAEFRNGLYLQALPRLQNLAYRALYVYGKKNSEIAVICIEVDSKWRGWVDQLMPGYDWESVRATGALPIAQGTVTWPACEFVAEQFPDIAHIAREVPPEGKMKAIVLCDNGCTIYELEPMAS